MADDKQHNTSDNRRNGQKHKDWAFQLPKHSCPRTPHCCYQLNRAERHIKKNCREFIVSESLDDQRSEGRDTAARDTSQKQSVAFSQHQFTSIFGLTKLRTALQTTAKS